MECSWLAFSTGPKNTFVDKERVKVVWSRIYVWPDTDDIELEQREPIWHIGAFAWQDSFWNTKISPARWKGNSTRKRLNAKCVYFSMQIGDTVKINISKTAHVWKTYKNKVVNTGTCFSVAISYKLKLLSVINHFSNKIISFSCNLSYRSTASPTQYTGNIYIYLA